MRCSFSNACGTRPDVHQPDRGREVRARRPERARILELDPPEVDERLVTTTRQPQRVAGVVPRRGDGGRRREQSRHALETCQRGVDVRGGPALRDRQPSNQDVTHRRRIRRPIFLQQPVSRRLRGGQVARRLELIQTRSATTHRRRRCSSEKNRPLPESLSTPPRTARSERMSRRCRRCGGRDRRRPVPRAVSASATMPTAARRHDTRRHDRTHGKPSFILNRSSPWRFRSGRRSRTAPADSFLRCRRCRHGTGRRQPVSARSAESRDPGRQSSHYRSRTWSGRSDVRAPGRCTRAPWPRRSPSRSAGTHPPRSAAGCRSAHSADGSPCSARAPASRSRRPPDTRCESRPAPS